ncbi:MAG: MarC family protein [Desulfobaccales bacterium]|jgi:multiple antibiotic resistance protein
MGPWSHVPISDALIFFFLTLGPLKAIAPFAQLTQGTDPAFRRAVAWRATAIATIVVLAVALLGDLVLENWHVSVAAVVITGSIILFCQALQLIMQPLAAAPSPTPQAAGQPPPSLEIASFPLAIPALVTAPGIAAIAAFMAIAGSDWTQRGIVLAALLVIMGLNLATLLNIEVISRHGSPLAQRVFGWVLAVLQAALAAQYLINGLVRLGALSPLVS